MHTAFRSMDTDITLPNGKVIEKKVFSAYTKEELEEVIKCSKNYNEVLNLLKLNQYYHRYLVKFVKENNTDITHFQGPSLVRRTMQEILVKDSNGASSSGIKRYLLKEKLVENKCSVCKMDAIWNNKPLVLQLDHINGNHFDNRIENLRLICPNCHSQTDTFTGKNLRTYKEKTCKSCKKSVRRENVSGKCADCISKEKHLCSICKINKRPGKWSKCKDCRDDEINYKLCLRCNKPIKRAYNTSDYHGHCSPGEKIDK